MANSSQPLSLHAMRTIATGLLVFMAAVFVIAKANEHLHPAIGYIRAFAEASMVGALADWFAVTALFRRPLGLPIPHTAIIPRSKDRIGEGLGTFIAENFLHPDVIARRIDGVDLAGAAARWLGEPERLRMVGNALADAAPRLLELVDDDRVEKWLQDFAVSRLQAMDVSSALASGIAILTADGRHQEVVDMLLRHADEALIDEEPLLRQKVSANTGWMSKLFSADDKAADAMIAAVRDTIAEAAANPDHAVRRRFNGAVTELIYDLKLSPTLRDKVEEAAHKALEHPSVRAYVAEVWRDMKDSLAASDGTSKQALAARISEALGDLTAGLLKEHELRAALNERLSAWVITLADTRGADVGRIVADTVKSWDARTVVSQIENAVGRDLQYIRINGTLIGGLVGLSLHALTESAKDFGLIGG
jgi:uncharacterized membrane-anchored protein YjiN (DUF445 family)